nr:MAG TPA: hypothetical protein [Caudoviricetes sp.]DAY78933.1 MAG TPA: hypothetical protein [Caudoviricetes sp.]
MNIKTNDFIYNTLINTKIPRCIRNEGFWYFWARIKILCLTSACKVNEWRVRFGITLLPVVVGHQSYTFTELTLDTNIY